MDREPESAGAAIDELAGLSDRQNGRIGRSRIDGQESERPARIVGNHDADEILVMEQGRIVQRGCHADLVSIPGVYRELYELYYGLTIEEFAEKHAHRFSLGLFLHRG